MSVNISSKKRTRNIVDAKMVYSKLLRERGLTYTAIAKSLGKDHTTILHYIKQLDDIIDIDPNLNNSYSKCRDLFFEGREEMKEFNSIILQKKIREYAKEYDKLRLELDKYKEMNRRFKRLMGLVVILDQRIPKGEEEKYATIINRMFNGIEYYEKE